MSEPTPASHQSKAIGLREMTLSQDSVKQLQRIMSEPSKAAIMPKDLPAATSTADSGGDLPTAHSADSVRWLRMDGDWLIMTSTSGDTFFGFQGLSCVTGNVQGLPRGGWLKATSVDRVGELEQQVATLKERLHQQTMATQEAYQQVHNRVLKELERYRVIPESLDPHGHPIEQIVGTCLFDLVWCRLDALTRERGEAREAARWLLSRVYDEVGIREHVTARWPWLWEELG